MKRKNGVPASEDDLVLLLKELYEQHGYISYKMSKFEEYDLYVQNKNFLVSDSILTFTDASGRLMALKPDVTLSIVRGSKKDESRKVYYNEKVYRPDKNDRSFKEITQIGLEDIGDIGPYEICEVLDLAGQSLALTGGRAMLDVSDLGLLSYCLDDLTDDRDLQDKLLSCVSQKNPHDFLALCRENGLPEDKAGKAAALCTLEGKPAQVFPALSRLYKDPVWKKKVGAFKSILSAADQTRVRVDFSVTGDRNYYNGIVFRGFLDGVPESVLSGGQYDRLMEKMGKRMSALGFAIYLNVIERLYERKEKTDVDVLLLYDDRCGAKAVKKAVKEYTDGGKKVLAAKEVPQALRAGKTVDLRKVRGKGGE